MDIRQLRYFVAVAEAGSFSRAAARCHLTQPSLSQQIRKLEDELGVELLDRLGRGVALTDAGHALLPRARTILAEILDVQTNLQADLDEGRGRVTVGAIPTMAPYLLPELVAALRTTFPDSAVHVREDLTQNLVEALADNEVDVAIMSAPVDHPLIDLEIVGHESMLVVAPAEHPICATNTVSLPDLRQLPAVTLHEMHCLGKQINEFCAAKALAKNVVCRMTQIETLLEFVRLGLGISIVPQMVAQHDTNPGRAYRHIKRTNATRPIALAWRSGRTRPKLALHLATLLRNHFADKA